MGFCESWEQEALCWLAICARKRKLRRITLSMFWGNDKFKGNLKGRNVMPQYLNSNNFHEDRDDEKGRLADELEAILKDDGKDGILSMLAGYKKILSDNTRRDDWADIHQRMLILFKCGTFMPLDGPMIGVSMSIRDSDYFRETAKLFGKKRSIIANIEWMATLWNTTFGNTGIWMGKTFEPVSRETVAAMCDNHPAQMGAYNSVSTRIGRNFFRQPHNPTLLQLAGLPVLTPLWNLKDRPMTADVTGFDGQLLVENLESEKHIPYTKTGGLFLANPGRSVVPGMNQKSVYQLNYRWTGLNPAYPMTRLVDELVQIDEGIYLGQLVMATKNYSLGRINLPFVPKKSEIELGPDFYPGGLDSTLSAQFDTHGGEYAYQNNGFFLMIDPRIAGQAYADNAFAQLRPQAGEIGFRELGYDKQTSTNRTVTGTVGHRSDKLSPIADWCTGWKQDAALHEKFTTFCLEPSPKDSDGDVRELLREGESILQMLKRIQTEISAQTKHDDHLEHFEKLNRLFRNGVAPVVKDGMFQGQGKGCNVRFSGLEDRTWYGKSEPLNGFDYYHGATLNLHWGFGDTLREHMDQKVESSHMFPASIAALLKDNRNHPNLLNMVWSSIARFIFPWAGKSYEKLSGRKLSMLLDESDNLTERYPERVGELKRYLASRPHYDLVKKNANHHWKVPGVHAEHLINGSWDHGMTDADKSYWTDQAENKWIFGNNLEDARIVAADPMIKMLDMNYRTPEKPLLELAESGPSPFVRLGYIFLGTAGEPSILPMNNGPEKKKTVFQFHYRYPMIGGPAPIGSCLDEIVEIAQGLYLGQLIYSTKPLKSFHSSIEPAEFAYQLFGYFLLLDNDWEYHRQAIGLDVLNPPAA